MGVAALTHVGPSVSLILSHKYECLCWGAERSYQNATHMDVLGFIQVRLADQTIIRCSHEPWYCNETKVNKPAQPQENIINQPQMHCI